MRPIISFLLPLCTLTASAQTTITLKDNDKGRIFEGIGAVSAGASTRNLVDYPAKQRAEVLDLLFKPKFGAGFQHLKVEIGSGENSTCGSEPSHVITRQELDKPQPRGYEFWFMAEAKKRNPLIMLDCLPWGYPNWVDGRFTRSTADWFVSFLATAKKFYGLDIDYISAAQNENGTDLNWVNEILRPTLKTYGFGKVKLQAPDDDSDFWKVFEQPQHELLDAVGYHYVDGREPWDIDQKTGHPATDKAKSSGKALWASEEWSQSGKEWGGKGALYLARLMNKLYTRDRITKFEIWCPLDGIYDPIIWGDTGALQADAPWSGHYTVWPSVWTIAHTTQFAQPGWTYLDQACGQFDQSTWRGSYVSLRDPKTKDWSVIMVTGEKREVDIQIDGLKEGVAYLWTSTENTQFIRQNPIKIKNHHIKLDLEADAVYTLTTTTGQVKGSFPNVPEAKPFPLPYKEDFTAYTPGKTAKYLSDQKGTFETYQFPGGGMCLAQIVPAQGILWYGNWLLKPHSLFGDANWRDYTIEADIYLAGGDTEIGGRYAGRDKLGYRWILSRDGRWQLNWQYSVLASGQLEHFDPAAWYHLSLSMQGEQISGSINNKTLCTVNNKSGTQGMAFLASTYDHNLFDNLWVH